MDFSAIFCYRFLCVFLFLFIFRFDKNFCFILNLHAVVSWEFFFQINQIFFYCFMLMFTWFWNFCEGFRKNIKYLSYHFHSFSWIKLYRFLFRALFLEKFFNVIFYFDDRFLESWTHLMLYRKDHVFYCG